MVRPRPSIPRAKVTTDSLYDLDLCFEVAQCHVNLCVVNSSKSPDKFLMGIHLRTTGCRLPYGITQCYLPPDTSELTPP